MSTHSLTTQPWRQAIDQARQDHQAGDLLWPALLTRTGLQPEALVQALWQSDGVGVLSLGDLQSATLPWQPLPDGRGFQGRLGQQKWIVVRDPWAREAGMALRTQPGARLALASPEQWTWLAQQVADTVPTMATEHRVESLAQSPVVAFVDRVIAHAHADGASDIHFESSRQGVAVKYRLDGVMTPGETLSGQQRAEEVISRIKVLAQLDITERRRPQDGRIRWSCPSAPNGLDLRVSVMPSIFGEDAVLRLLDKTHLKREADSISLNSIGFDAGRAQQVRALAERPHGMLLVTGPTGSGKTTTVYAALTEVNSGLEKIITIEDPVEYELPGVLQIPVNEQKGLTFATGLRSILRHDPDKILVGEIRDAETAQIAVQSSLTGHLVFTTVHANNLFDVLGRFRHFGIEPFALASALNGVVVQRLLRRICQSCRQWQPITEEAEAVYAQHGLGAPAQVPLAVGCAVCRNTGYKGRLVVAEVHAFNDDLRDLMIQDFSMPQLRRLLYADPSTRLLGQALAIAAQGYTSLPEVHRVVGFS